MQQLMSLCWEQKLTIRPQISQILKWCDLPEFQSLRTVYPLDNGQLHAVCQCTVNRTHCHTLSSNPPCNVKFTLQLCNEFDQLFTVPEIASPKLDPRIMPPKFDLKKSKRHTQVWIAQEVNDNTTQLQIITYRSTQIGYRVSSYANIWFINKNNFIFF